MALEHKSELKAVELLFTDDAFKANTTWWVGAWDSDAKKWVGTPVKECATLPHDNTDDMKRFNDALGVMHAECVRRTVAAQEAEKRAQRYLEDAKRETKGVREVLDSVRGELRAAQPLAAKGSLVAGIEKELKAALERTAFYQMEAVKWQTRQPSWLYRLTLGFFGS